MIVFIIIAAVVIVLAIVKTKMDKDQGYTMGKNIFKSSEYFIDNDDKKPKDVSDFDYWNKDQLK